MIKVAKYEFNLQDDVFFNRIALVLYAQGCKWNCKGCHSKELWTFEGGQELTPKDIVDTLDKRRVDPKEITIVGQGGDFWFQFNEWLEFCKMIKNALPDIKIAWQTGAPAEAVKRVLYNYLYPFDVIACERPFKDTSNTENRKYLIWEDGREEWKVLP